MQALKPSDPLRQEASEILGAARRISGIAAQLTEFARRQGKPASKVNIGETIFNLRSKINTAAGERVAVELTREPRADHGHGGSGAVGRSAHGSGRGRAEEYSAGTDADHHRRGRSRRSRSVYRPPLWPRAGMLASPFATTGMDWTRSRPRACSIRCSARPAIRRRRPRHWLWRAPTAWFMSGEATSPSSASPARVRRSRSICRWSNLKVRRWCVRLRMRKPRPAEAATILVVEDEAGIRELIRKILSRERYSVLEAGSAEEALTHRTRASDRSADHRRDATGNPRAGTGAPDAAGRASAEDIVHFGVYGRRKGPGGRAFPGETVYARGTTRESARGIGIAIAG